MGFGNAQRTAQGWNNYEGEAMAESYGLFPQFQFPFTLPEPAFILSFEIDYCQKDLNADINRYKLRFCEYR